MTCSSGGVVRAYTHNLFTGRHLSRGRKWCGGAIWMANIEKKMIVAYDRWKFVCKVDFIRLLRWDCERREKSKNRCETQTFLTLFPTLFLQDRSLSDKKELKKAREWAWIPFPCGLISTGLNCCMNYSNLFTVAVSFHFHSITAGENGECVWTAVAGIERIDRASVPWRRENSAQSVNLLRLCFVVWWWSNTYRLTTGIKTHQIIRTCVCACVGVKNLSSSRGKGFNFHIFPCFS